MSDPTARQLAVQLSALSAAVHVLLDALSPAQKARAASQLEPILQFARSKLESSRASDAEVALLAEMHESMLKALQQQTPDR